MQRSASREVDDLIDAARRDAVEKAVEWVDLHTSGLSAPNASDLDDMREWCGVPRRCPRDE